MFLAIVVVLSYPLTAGVAYGWSQSLPPGCVYHSMGVMCTVPQPQVIPAPQITVVVPSQQEQWEQWIVSMPAVPEKRVENRMEAAGGVQVNTTCTHCTVTNKVHAAGINAEEKVLKLAPKPAPASKQAVSKPKKNGNGGDAKPAVTREYYSWMLAGLLVAAVLILVLLATLVARSMGRGGSRSDPPNPMSAPAPPAPAGGGNASTPGQGPAITGDGGRGHAGATSAARRPPRVHAKKCQHDGCPHTVAICCHNGDNGQDAAH